MTDHPHTYAMSAFHPPKMDYRKALLSTAEEHAAIAKKVEDARAEEERKMLAELEEKNILHKLPLDVRTMIWRLLLRCEATILPSWWQWETTRERKVGHGRYRSYPGPDRKCYAYQWNESKKLDDQSEYPNPYVDRQLSLVKITEPTYKQAQLIADGHLELPLTFLTEHGLQTGCDAVLRGESGEAGAQIINRVDISLRPFKAVALLRVCKQVNKECAKILYGENTFAFKVGGVRSDGQYVHEYDEFEHISYRIPGFSPFKPQSSKNFEKALDMMFTRYGFRPKFVARDPMLGFFNRIGRVNTSLLTKIQIEGKMKTGWKREITDYDPSEFHIAGMGLARVLPILTTILRRTCPQLRALTLHMEDKELDIEDLVWDDDLRERDGKSNETRIDELVEQVVLGLPTLEILNLGGHQFFDKQLISQGEWKDLWGKSARWMKVIADGAAEKAAERFEGYRRGLTKGKMGELA